MPKSLRIMVVRHLTYSRPMVGGGESNRAGGLGRWDGGAAPELDAFGMPCLVTTAVLDSILAIYR
jgi:hypothetical protein